MGVMGMAMWMAMSVVEMVRALASATRSRRPSIQRAARRRWTNQMTEQDAAGRIDVEHVDSLERDGGG